MTKFIFAIAMLSSSIASADTFVCTSIFGDGVDAKVSVHIGAATDGHAALPYVEAGDASGAYRQVTISNIDALPGQTLNAYGIGIVEGQKISLALIDDKGVNIGVMANGLKAPDSIRFDLFKKIAGDWLTCSPE